MTHIVEVPCDCDDVEHCAMERYLADIRVAFAEIERLSRILEEFQLEAVV